MSILFLLITVLINPVVLCSETVPAKKNTLKFDHFTREQGLSNNMVTVFFQDDIGYLWIGTLNGLNRYDGADFKIYLPDAKDTSTLSDNHITHCIQSENGTLFVGTFHNGLNQYSYKDDNFIRIPPDSMNSNGYDGNFIVTLIKDSKNRIWMGTDKGLFEVFDNPVRFQRHAVVCQNLPSPVDQSVTALIEDSKGNIWFGTSGKGEIIDGLICYNPDTKRAVWYPGANLICLTIDRNDVLWGGTWGSGLMRFDPRKGTFEQLDFTHESIGRIIKDVMVDQDGILWIATWENGLSRIDTNTFSLSTNSAKSWLQSGLSDNSLNCLYQDREGTLWIGTLHNGINYSNPLKFQFNHYTHDPSDPSSLSELFCYSLFEDSKGVVWAGVQGGGLNRLDTHTGKFTAYKYDPGNPDTLGLETVISLEEDANGLLWIGTHLNGLLSFDRKTQQFARFEFPSLTNGEADVIRDIHYDRMGHLWLCEESHGLYEIDPDFKTYRNYSDRIESKYRLSSSETRAIREDQNGNLWIATNSGGLNVIDPSAETIRVFQHDVHNPDSLQSDSVVDILIDSESRVWIGTSTGLDLFNESLDGFVHCKAINEYVCGIETDFYRDLWIATRNGLIHFNPRSMKIVKRYLPEDGVQDYTFHERAHCKGKNGLLYFGGNNGFNQFNPEWFNNAPELVPMPVVVTKVVTDRLVHNYPNSQNFTITLPYGTNIVFQYAGLSFINPKRALIEYKLEGYDDRWISGDESCAARYTNLPPGKFVFRVVGANAQGVWNREGARISVIVPPPFWQTVWFIILSILFVSVFFLLIHSLRISYIKKINIRLEQQVDKRTRELKSSQERIYHLQKLEAIGRLVSGLAHNMNNLLCGILGNIFLIKRKIDPQVLPHIQSMEETATRVSELVKNMMHFSQDAVIDCNSIDVKDVVSDVYHLIKDTFDERIQIHLEIRDDTPFVHANSFYLHSAIMNICMNAQEAILAILDGKEYPERYLDSFMIDMSVHTIHNSNVPLKIFQQNTVKCNRYTVIQIRDNGIGIEPENRDLLFEPFHTTKETVGTGLGLSSAYGSVSRFGGVIDFESVRGKETTFRIFLPAVPT